MGQRVAAAEPGIELEFTRCLLDLNTRRVQLFIMARKTITIDRDSYARLAAAQRPGETFSQTIDRLARVKTNADALNFYRHKKTWLSPAKLTLIEGLRSRRRRSPRQ